MKSKSIIYSITDEEFISLVKRSKKMKEIYDYFKVANVGDFNIAVKSRIKALNIDTTHIMSRIEASRSAREVTKEIFEKEWLTENSSKNPSNLKLYLVKFSLLPYFCISCKNNGTWLEKPMVLQLEHKDGVNSNNKIENLCFLCPNCHSQTDTFAGKNLKNTKKQNLLASKSDQDIVDAVPLVRSKAALLRYFGMSISGDAYTRVTRILSENPNLKFKNQKTKIIWPSPFEVQKLLWEKPTIQIAKDLGLSDKAVESYAKKHELTKPPRGYWQKQNVLPSGSAPPSSP